MSKVHTPQEKKRLSYERDHYHRAGESERAWRVSKRVKKKKASRAFRKNSRDLLRIAGEESGHVNAQRKFASIKKEKIHEWGSMRLKDFVVNRQQTRAKRSDVNSLNRKIKTRNQQPKPTR